MAPYSKMRNLEVQEWSGQEFCDCLESVREERVISLPLRHPSSVPWERQQPIPPSLPRRQPRAPVTTAHSCLHSSTNTRVLSAPPAEPSQALEHLKEHDTPLPNRCGLSPFQAPPLRSLTRTKALLSQNPRTSLLTRTLWPIPMPCLPWQGLRSQRG